MFSKEFHRKGSDEGGDGECIFGLTICTSGQGERGLGDVPKGDTLRPLTIIVILCSSGSTKCAFPGLPILMFLMLFAIKTTDLCAFPIRHPNTFLCILPRISMTGYLTITQRKGPPTKQKLATVSTPNTPLLHQPD